jgi:PIN domain nuclease of toxin-antitoxin system
LDAGYIELPVLGQHAVEVDSLPPIHKDPFDRILVAQSMVEGITLLTADAEIAKYPGPIRKV